MKLYDLTELSPREAMDAYPGPNIPVRGGWGYSAEDACIIDKNDPIIDPDGPMPFYGVGFEKIFLERRIHMELIISLLLTCLCYQLQGKFLSIS